MERTIDKKTGQQILISKSLIFIPSIIIGGFLGIYYYQMNNSIDPKLIYTYVIPFTLIICLTAAYIGSKIAVNKLVNTKIELIGKDLVKKTPDSKTVKIPITNKIRIKENWMGLRIIDNQKSIHIPKQINNYLEFRTEIYSIKKSS